MEKLEEMLDQEVGEYLGKVRGMEEVKALLSGGDFAGGLYKVSHVLLHYRIYQP